ncbi:PREDICTED: uncharacterized protein LOC109130763 [Camelina sativa]|uniref:Uncharacterized protein LOC109130763 n=1 Tax=Camelina sativa TaxID=90675 RepID=A0ABM1RBD1_CAMSA|nr:PREDICTED: uncharacterized protein LOC109130763 [Camelina sativa]
MEKISKKCVFLVVISVMSTVTIRNVEAKRLLHEEISQMKLHHEVPTQVITPQRFHCETGYYIKCVPDPFFVICLCQC